MKLTNERSEKMVKFDLEDISDEDYAKLVHIGLERIKLDKPALAEYAIIKVLEDFILKKEEELDKQETDNVETSGLIIENNKGS